MVGSLGRHRDDPEGLQHRGADSQLIRRAETPSSKGLVVFEAGRPGDGPDGAAGFPPASDHPWARSLWLDGVVQDLTPREQLSGDHTCDVAIVGAGFGGLWTAYYLKLADPA